MALMLRSLLNLQILLISTNKFWTPSFQSSYEIRWKYCYVLLHIIKSICGKNSDHKWQSDGMCVTWYKGLFITAMSLTQTLTVFTQIQDNLEPKIIPPPSTQLSIAPVEFLMSICSWINRCQYYMLFYIL